MNDIIAKCLGDWCIGVSWGGVILKVLLSAFLGTIVGCERATKRHAAGMRTFVLVSLISTLAAMLDGYLIRTYDVKFPVAVGATVIGIAIVSSNTILYSSKNRLKGLTTSVALWGACFVSALIGLDLYFVAVVSFVVYMLCLTSFIKIEYAFRKRSKYFEIHLELNNKNSLRDFVTAVRRLGLKIDDIEFNAAYVNSGLFVYSVALTILTEQFKKVSHDDVIAAISQLEYVNYVEELDR